MFPTPMLKCNSPSVFLQVTFASFIMSFGLCIQVGIAYPEFQQFSEKNSGRTTNCASCHENATGPAGNGSGQIGSLTIEEFAKLNEARTAFEPGKDVDSPILNRFGDLLIKKLGKRKVLEDRKEPAKLASDYGFQSDIDQDGIPDAQEFLDGTDPQNQHHGDAWRLFVVNINRYAPHIIAAAIGVLLLDWGFARMIGGFMAIKRARKKRST
ncbi:MAG: hypothetical protein K2X77_19055 [Candidatus Obscuribacterales bacterium]|jgi:cytochrome c553|nr:hypothetical protein [Candidatus Obscuribacterales bacterium]